ncbi:hypothetical protein [Brevibacterium salitolerans]|uniref:DUF4287 domain-containing protein n=1 Tax=Brevibacterium salitolerans TaxID=1403566 RepID=A0ABP5IFD4_9MICO
MAENRNEEVPERVRAIEAATGLPWQVIVDAFEAAGGEALTHGRLAEAIHPVIAERIGNAGWWAQGATVAYEQQIGRRVAGQSSRGDFQVSATRTLPAETSDRAELRDRAGAAVQAAAEAGSGLGALRPDGEPRTSDTPKRLYWRCGLSDGAKIQVSVEEKAPGGAARGGTGGAAAAAEAGSARAAGTSRALLALTVTGLATAAQREAVRTDLKRVLAEL